MEAKRVTLPKNRIDGRSVLTQSMFNRNADEYIVRRQYDLRGDTITIPEGVKLVFKGAGCFTHGTIVGQESTIKAGATKRVFNDVTILGCWNVEDIYSNWFDFGSEAFANTRNFQNMCTLTGDEYPGVVHITDGDYVVGVDIDNISCLKPNSNTIVILEGNLILQPNNLGSYNIIEIVNKHDIFIWGRGSVVGDVKNHTGHEGEWGMGVNISSSRNITLQDITIKNCWGDCIYLGQAKIARDEYSENVKIVRVTCEGGRRQGLSMIAGKDIHIKQCRFNDTGKYKFTSPGRGIDIEPNSKDNTIIQGVVIEDCSFFGNHENNDFMTYNLNRGASIRVVRCKMEGSILLHQNSYNVVIDSCEVHSLEFVDSAISNNVVRNTVFTYKKPNTGAPQKVRFDNCEYRDKETSSLLNVLGIPSLLMSGFILVCVLRNNRIRVQHDSLGKIFNS